MRKLAILPAMFGAMLLTDAQMDKVTASGGIDGSTFSISMPVARATATAIGPFTFTQMLTLVMPMRASSSSTSIASNKPIE